MTRKISIRLNPESIQQAINELTAFRDDVVRIMAELGEELVAEGVEIARAKIIMYEAVESGNLLSSMEGFFDPVSGRGYIKNSSGHAAYVEYGTGIVGATNSSHEPKPFGWQHDVNNYGDWGWVYDNGRWTKGLKPRPYMWDTWLELCNRANEKVRAKYG